MPLVTRLATLVRSPWVLGDARGGAILIGGERSRITPIAIDDGTSMSQCRELWHTRWLRRLTTALQALVLELFPCSATEC